MKSEYYYGPDVKNVYDKTTRNSFTGMFIGQVGSYPAIAFPDNKSRDLAAQVLAHYHTYQHLLQIPFPLQIRKNGDIIEPLKPIDFPIKM